MKLVYRKAEPRDLAAVKRLIDVYIAEDYYSPGELEEMLGDEKYLFYVVTDADRDDAVIAYFIAFIAPLDEALPLLHVSERPQRLLGYGGDTPVGVYKTASIEKEYQGNGICTHFTRSLEPVLRERGAKMIMGTALHPLGQKIPMRHIFEKNGFSAIAEITRPWVDMYLYCPYCRRHHCICDAVFYMKELDREEDVHHGE